MTSQKTVRCSVHSGFVLTVRRLVKVTWLIKRQIAAYFAFSATIVLYVYVIQKRASPPEVYSKYFAAATRCQSHLSRIAQKESLPERYCLVLEELRVEALRQTKCFRLSTTGLEEMDSYSRDNGFQTTSLTIDESPSTNYTSTDLMGETGINFNAMANSAVADYSGWGQFASMVSSGLGNFDALLNDDSFRM